MDKIKFKITFVLIIVIIGLLFINFINTKSLEIFNVETVKLDFVKIDDLNYENSNKSKKVYQSFFTKKEFEKFNNPINKLVFYRMNTISYKVFINKKFIGHMNPYEKRQGKMISNYKSYDIFEDDIKENNVITVETLVEYDDILSDFPIVLTNPKHSYYMENFIKIFFQMPFLLLMSIILFLLVFFIALNMKIKNSIGNYFYYLGSSLFILLSFIEFFNPYILNISPLLYKKILVISFWMPIIFLKYKFYEEYNSKKIKYVSFIMLIALSLPIIIINDYETFSLAYNLCLPVFFLGSFIWIYEWIKEYKKYKVLQILFPFIILMYVFGFYDAINHVLGRNYNSFSFYAALLFNILLIVVISEEYYQIYLDGNHHRERFKEISEIAKRDSMTGIYNYEYIKKYIEEYKKAYSLMIIDIDNFKYINDKYGHSVGDKAILKLVNLMKKNSTDTDLLARFGGDEFIIVSKDIKKLDEISAELVNGFKIEYEGTDIRIFISIGIIHSNFYLPIEEMFEKADENLYEAKNSGKAKIIRNIV